MKKRDYGRYNDKSVERIFSCSATQGFHAINKSLYDLFYLKGTTQVKQLLDNILSTKEIKTYFFSRTNNQVIVKDISPLDANSKDADISEWGGISSFTSNATDIVSTYTSD